MGQVSNAEALNLFKNVYGDLQNLLPQDYLLQKDIPFSQKQRVGAKYVEGVVLSCEVGVTLGGSSMDAFTIDPAVAGSVKQAEVESYSIVLPSVIPYGVISRTAGGGERAFYDGTKHLVQNNLKSHGKFQEIFRLYGQADYKLGTVSYATATYRGVAFATGTGTLESRVTGGNVAFTNGVNAASKAILFQPGQFAAGHWVGMENLRIQQVRLADNVVVAEGRLLQVDAIQGIIFVDFDPVAATAEYSHAIAIKGQRDLKEMIGINKILQTTGTLFNIPTADYSLWRGNRVDLAQKKFTLERLQNGIADAVNQGGLDGDIVCYVNPRSWANLVTTESGARRYDDSYKSGEASNGFESITFYHQTGKATIKAHRMVKEGEVFGMHLPDWSRSGSAEVSFKIPGMDNREEIFPLENQAAYGLRSYSDQYVFCHAPAKSLIWTGVNDEASS